MSIKDNKKEAIAAHDIGISLAGEKPQGRRNGNMRNAQGNDIQTTLYDLISAIAEESDSAEEVIAVARHLFSSRRVTLCNSGQPDLHLAA